MQYIAHRGLFEGPDVNTENRPQQIDLAIEKGYDCEVDLWCINDELYLGHDHADYKIDIDWLIARPLWIHAKNLEALEYLTMNPFLNYFWTDRDEYALTSQNYIWSNPGSKLAVSSVMVMPEYTDPTLLNTRDVNCYGICSDYIERIKEIRKGTE
jgi:hypothetical protein